MKVDWLALLQVALVTFVGTLVVVGVVSLAAALLDKSQLAAAEGRISSPYRSPQAIAAYALFALAFALVAFGLYLLIPWWH